MSLRGARRRAGRLEPLWCWLSAGLLLGFVALAVRETHRALTTGSPLAPARAGSFWVLSVVGGVAFYFLLLAPERPSGTPPSPGSSRTARRARRRRAVSRGRRRRL